MRFWWVNQNQTFDHEQGGGYLWSPQTNANGARNQFYENMLLVQEGDIVFSFTDTYIMAVGYCEGPAFEAMKPKVFGAAGQNWNQKGWCVPVSYRRPGKEKVRPKDHMDRIAPLLPKKYSPLQLNGNGLQGVYLAEISAEFGALLMHLTETPELTRQVTTLAELTVDNEEQEIIQNASLAETVKVAMVQARRGQGKFRERVQMLEIGCRVTQVTQDKLLVASHIKPWRESDNIERLDGNNGLFLSPHVDALFDGGFISFTKKGEFLISPRLEKDVLERWSIDPRNKVGSFNADQAFFLEHHNEKVFKAS